MASNTGSELSRRNRGFHRGDPIKTRLVQTRLVRGASTNSSRAQNWGLLAVTAMAMVTMIFSMFPASRSVASPPHVGHQTLFGKSERGAISIEGQPGSARRVLQDDVVNKPLVDYETQLELFMCNPSLTVEGNNVYIVGEEEMAAALARVNGLGQVREHFQ